MDELRVYVDALFARRGDTAENREMKEEIYGNLAARRDDLIAQGVPEAEAVRAAKAQLPSLDGVLGTVVRVNAQQWRTARLQSLLLASGSSGCSRSRCCLCGGRSPVLRRSCWLWCLAFGIYAASGANRV